MRETTVQTNKSAVFGKCHNSLSLRQVLLFIIIIFFQPFFDKTPESALSYMIILTLLNLCQIISSN